MKVALGFALAFGLGFACRAFGIPSPAPPVLTGALLVLAMTCGYVLVDRFVTHPAWHARNCAGPTGCPPSHDLSNSVSKTPPTPSKRRSDMSGYATKTNSEVTRVAAAVTANPILHFIALLGLCAAYLQGGIDKLADFNGAIAEAQHFGLYPAAPIAIATIITEFAAPALILTGFYRWLGAWSLAGFTLIAMLVANRFWELPMPDRFMVENAFFEHLGLVGGFLLVAWQDLKRGRPLGS